MELSMGLDFGTCNIKVSHFIENTGNIRMLKLQKVMGNDYLIPNEIYYKSPTECYVGKMSRAGMDDLENRVDHIKRKLELKDWECRIPALGVTLTAEEIAEDILAWIRKSVEENGDSIRQVVMTMPVCFSEVQKDKLIRAAKRAGLPVIWILTEPVAALLSIHELLEKPCQETVVTFDFGGSTLDLCLAEVENTGEHVTIQVASSVGVNFGGVDITNAIYEKSLYPRYQEIIDKALEEDPHGIVRRDLLAIAEELKTRLFSGDCFDDEDDNGAGVVQELFMRSNDNYELQLSETDALTVLNALGADKLVRNALDELFESAAELQKEDVTMVRAFGGTSRIGYFRDLLEDYFGRAFDGNAFDGERAYTAVAKGAAQYFAALGKGVSHITVNDAVPYYLGMERDGEFLQLLQKNDSFIQETRGKGFSTEQLDEMNWVLNFYQAFSPERANLDGENGAVYIGRMELDPRRYRDAKAVRFTFAADPERVLIGRSYVRTPGATDQRLVEEIPIKIGG